MVYNVVGMKKKIQKRVEVLEYKLPVTITPLEEGGYLARCEKLQGCMAEGETMEQALSFITDVARNIIDIRREEGMNIPLRVIEKADLKSKVELSIPLIYRLSHG